MGKPPQNLEDVRRKIEQSLSEKPQSEVNPDVIQVPSKPDTADPTLLYRERVVVSGYDAHPGHRFPRAFFPDRSLDQPLRDGHVIERGTVEQTRFIGQEYLVERLDRKSVV